MSVDAKTSRSGWGKRQATFILYIFANGEARLCPALIFHGQGNVTAAKRAAYYPGVVVKLNKEAYNNEDLLLPWIDQQLKPILQGNTMLVMEVASFYKTDAVRNRLQKGTPSLRSASNDTSRPDLSSPTSRHISEEYVQEVLARRNR